MEYSYYDINKLKLIFTEVASRCFKLKITWKHEDYIFGASHLQSHQDLPTVFYIFAKIIYSKLCLMGRKSTPILEPNSCGYPEPVFKNSHIHGILLKKSRVISRWTEIFVVVKREGLFYYKKTNDKGHLLVPRGSIAQLWTRF